MEAHQGNLVFLAKKEGKSVISYALKQVHVVCLDSKNKKYDLDEQNHFCFFIKVGEQKRSLLFDSERQMKDAIDFILIQQGLPAKRLSQYKRLHTVNLHEIVGDCSILIHRLTKEKFVSKTIMKNSNQSQINQMRQEIEVLGACRKLKRIVRLIDVVDDQDSITYILKYFEQKSLKEILDLGAELEMNEVLRMLQDIAEILRSIHKLRIVHRRLTLNSIRVIRSEPDLQLIIGGFDLACKLSYTPKTIDEFEQDLAPEFKAG